MPKGVEHRRDSRKKAKATLKEKRLRKKEKKMRHESEHRIEEHFE
jgi:hypothetical protein